jgi:hypothetical protein
MDRSCNILSYHRKIKPLLNSYKINHSKDGNKLLKIYPNSLISKLELQNNVTKGTFKLILDGKTFWRLILSKINGHSKNRIFYFIYMIRWEINGVRW